MVVPIDIFISTSTSRMWVMLLQ